MLFVLQYEVGIPSGLCPAPALAATLERGVDVAGGLLLGPSSFEDTPLDMAL